jgi:hypothetical protein
MFELIDVEKVHSRNSHVLTLPSRVDREHLFVGDTVVLVIADKSAYEEISVKVTGKNEEKFTGEFKKSAFMVGEFLRGDPVEFEPHHIMSIRRTLVN